MTEKINDALRAQKELEQLRKSDPSDFSLTKNQSTINTKLTQENQSKTLSQNV